MKPNVRAILNLTDHLPADCRDILRRFESFIGQFVNHYAQTDGEFVGLARSLRRLYEIAQRLAALVSDRLMTVKQVVNESRIAGHDGIAVAALQDLRDGLAEAAEELNVLASIGRNLRKLQRHIESLERVGFSIRMSVFGFAIESARTQKCRDAFGSFAAELRALGDRVTGVATTIESHLGTTRAAQQKEWQALSTNHTQLLHLGEQLETTTVATANEVQRMLNYVLQGLQQAGDGMHQITHHAGEAVFYLQFGDIIRQKTEHIAEALRETVGTLAPPCAQQEFCARAGAADHIIALQIRQLRLIQAEVTSAHQNLSESFHALARETDRIRGILTQWQTFSPGRQNESNPLAAFKAELLRMESLHRRGHELRSAARRSTQNAVDESHQLGRHVGTVNALNSDIHLQALNAIVKTASLGQEGVTLSVLSMHVDSLYGESRDVVKAFVEDLESVVGQVRPNSTSQTLDFEATRESCLRAGMCKIESAFDGCRSAFIAANELVEQQAQALGASRSLLGFLAEQGTVIESQIHELNCLRQALVPWVAGAQGTAAGIESLSHRYTMQSERDVHQSALPPVPGDDSADHNLEFFEPEQSGACAIAPPEPESKPEDSGRKVSLVIAAPAPPAVGMGDNVELF